MTIEERQTVPARILDWMRAGYPQGIPARDYVALLGVLRRRLTDDDISAIAADLALQADASDSVITEHGIRRMIREHAFQSAAPADITRVSAQLAQGGWPLSDDFPD